MADTPGSTDATPTSSTGTQGGNPATTPAPKPDRVLVQERVQSHRAEAAKAKAKGAEAERPAGEQPPAKTEQVAGDAETQGEKADEAKGKKEPDTIPMKAFKERLAREGEKRRALQETNTKLELENSQAREALRIAGAEVARLTKALQEGQKFDETAEQLRGHQLADEARQTAEKLQHEHEQRLAKAEEQAALTAERERISEEVDAALKSHELLHRSELLAACRRKENLSRSIAEVAAELEAGKLEKAKLRLVPERQPHPETVRGQRGGGGAVTYSNDRAGITARLRTLRQMQAT